MPDLKGKRVIITGGTHGIGESTALLFGIKGASVLITGRDRNRAEQIRGLPGGENIEFRRCDFTIRSETEELATWIESQTPPYNVLINNASRNSRYSILDLTLKEWDEMVELNLTSILSITRAFSKKLVDLGSPGKVINVGAIQSFFPLNSSVAYSTVKGGLRALTKSLAVDLGPYGILVNLVSPGPIYAKAESEEPPTELDSRAATVLGRMGRKIEVAKLLAFLASDDNTFMTGNEIIIDGGRSISRKSDPQEVSDNTL